MAANLDTRPKPEIPEIFSGSCVWFARPRLRPDLDNTFQGLPTQATVEGFDLRARITPKSPGGGLRYPAVGAFVWGCAWHTLDMRGPPQMWFPKILITRTEVMHGPACVDLEGVSVGSWFGCDPELDTFLVPIIRDGCVTTLGVFADWLAEQGDAFGNFLHALYRRDFAAGRISGETVEHVAKHFGAFTDATQS